MRHEPFLEVLAQFPSGRFCVNSLQLRDLLVHGGCTGVGVRVLNLGTMLLDKQAMIDQLDSKVHPRMDDIKVTCLDGEIIIDQGAVEV